MAELKLTKYLPWLLFHLTEVGVATATAQREVVRGRRK